MTVYNVTPSGMTIHATGPQSVSTAGLELLLRIGLNGPAGPFQLDVAASIDRGAFVALTGPSGAGKTTLLRMLAGLTRPDHGVLRVKGATWLDTAARIDVPTRRRTIGFVFQDYALFPNMTVRRHLDYAIDARDAARVDDLLRLARLERLADAYPARLSGGQRQRLALIRALARRPTLLMLDEPLSALDPAMRAELQDEIKRLHRQFGTTTILVSHDASEILRMADRMIRLDQGRVVFDGTPAQAFGLSTGPDGFHKDGVHVSGPDAAGDATALIDGESWTLRYGKHPPPLAPGDAVRLHFREADVSKPREG